jgi:sulfur-carrier protein adenylyltransferase/sulfurtransferase
MNTKHAPLSEAELSRYARHLTLPEFGMEAQMKLKAARVLCIGTGGLGSPITLYLAAAGVGTLGLVEADTVERSNLQRQILFGESQVGQKKLDAACARLQEANLHVQLVRHDTQFTAANAQEIAAGYDIIVDGTDNFPTRYLSNDVAVWQRKPNVYGSISRFEGQVSVFAPHLGGPCYRCMAPQPPKPGLVPSCAEGGVLGVLPGLVGTLQALEVIKLITGIGQPLLGQLLHVDTLSMRFRTFQLRRDEQCPVCGHTPSITAPIDYAGFCGLSPAATSLPSIRVQELYQLRLDQKNHLLLDVREPAEWTECRIPGAVHIPLGQLAVRYAELPSTRPLYVHCKMGGRSAKAVQMLLELGLQDVINVSGGIQAWQEHIGQTEGGET